MSLVSTLDCTPNQWTFRNPTTVVQEHLEIITGASERTREKIPHIVDVPYGTLPRQKINIFGTDLPDDAPIIMFVHGGLWIDKSIGREKYEFLSETFHQNGIKSIFIGYELRPELDMLEISKSLKLAVSKCFEYINETKSNSVYFWGYSSGAQVILYTFIDHINSLPLEDQKKIKAVILTGGFYDVTNFAKNDLNEALNMDLQTAKMISPLLHKISCDRSTEFHIFAGEFECPVVLNQSKNLHKRLKNWEYKTTHEVIEDCDHFNIIEQIPDKEFILTRKILNIIQTTK